MPPKDTIPWSAIALSVWLLIVAIGVVIAAHGAGEPPFWDALSYVEKSKRFWDNIADHRWVNPLDVLPTIRPPGIIPVAYPFGFSFNFHRFYARMVCIPIVLLAAAAMVAGWTPRKNTAFNTVLLSLALILAGMPFLYQFQPNDILRTQSNWGLVDGLLSGLAAFAAAAAVRSVRFYSIGWSAAAAFVAAYSLFVKPAGLLVMGLVGIAWLLLTASSLDWSLTRLRGNKPVLRYIFGSLCIALIIYAWAIHAAFWSAYYSPENIEFGVRNLRIFHDEVVYAIDFSLISALLHHSAGWLVLSAIAAGLMNAIFNRSQLAAAGAAALTLIIGVWFWIFTTNIGDVRYFMPFVTMAFILTLPILLDLAERAPSHVAAGAAALAALPTILITLLLFVPAPPVWLQSQLGINLFTNLYQAENDQAARLLRELAEAKRDVSQIYIFDVSSVTRNFGAVIDYHNSIIHHEPYLRTVLPVDWQRGLSFRFDEIVHSDYLGFQPINDSAERAVILAKTTIDDYPDQARHMNAWASSIGPGEGVELVSETRFRLMRVTDPEKLATSLRRFAVQYIWPKSFQDNNASAWWAAAEK